MGPGAADLPGFGHLYPAVEHRRGISHARGGKSVHQSHHGQVQFAKLGFHVVFRHGNVNRRRYVLAEPVLKIPAKIVDIRAANGEASRLSMAAEAQKVMAHGAEGLKNIHTGNASTGSHAYVVGKGDHHHGIVVFFHQPGGGQADYAAVPAFPRQHNGPAPGKIVIFQLRLRPGHDLGFNLFAQGIFGV